MKNFKRFISIALCLILCMSFCAAAFAEDEPANPFSSVYLRKVLNVADGIDISDVDEFSFSFTGIATEVKNDDGDVVYKNDDAPANKTIKVEVGAQSDGVAEGAKALSEILSASDFAHAGVWTYEVAETTAAFETTADGVTKKLVVDDAKYTIRVDVQNSESGLVISNIIVFNEDGEKVNPSSETESGFVFDNTYTESLENENGVLKVTKSITGDYADKSKGFEITVALTLPEGFTVDDVALASNSQGTVGTTVTAELADGQFISFSKLPAGTTFIVSETQADGYQSKITGDVASEDAAYVQGDREVAGSGPVTSSAAVSIENNLPYTPPTGVVINNLPFILLVVLSVGGLCVYFAASRRRNDEA